MARTIARFFACGGVAGFFAAHGAGAAGIGREVILFVSLSALLTAGVVARWGAGWSRTVYLLPQGVAAGLIVIAAVLSPDPATAMAAGAMMILVVIDAYLFFSFPLASAQLAVCLVSLTIALVARGDVALGTALALDTMIVVLSTVTRGLVIRASGASRDPLTDLANRRGFDAALDHLLPAAARSGDRLSAALLDLDNFKTVNDTQGHEAGDRVLCRVADVWRRALPPDAVLARHGGDEFALLLPGTSGDAALELVRRVCELHPDVRLSVGVAELVPGDSAAQLMRRADTALYAAKGAGRGRCELEGGHASELARDLALALAQGDVGVHVQPILQLSSDTVLGVEALARWTHPVRGPVSPVEFIAVAEQHGLIGALGEHVLRSVCRQLADFHATTGRRLRVGVNASGLELADPTYPDRVRRVFAETGWPASETVVEVTESLLDAESTTAVATLHALREMGMGVAIDDFGTGYSSLSRLDTLPVNILKVDSSFTAAVTESPRRAQMLRSLVGMAQALGMDVVAEGVETPEQDALLREVGVAFAQGYLHGRPMPLAELAIVLGHHPDGELVTTP